MPFQLSEEQKDIKKAAIEWAQGKFEGNWDAQKIREQEDFPHKLYKEAIDLGFVGSWIPEEYGGEGLGVLDRCIITEAMSSVDIFFGLIPNAMFGTEAIYLIGTEEQKEKYLPKVFEDHATFSCAFTEASGGTDVASASTKAEQKDDKWLINGEKQFISNAGYSDYSIILCRTTPRDEVGKRHHGLSQIIIENPNEKEGWTVDKFDKMGEHCIPTYTVGLMDVEVPLEQVLGEEGKGFYQSMKFFDFTRPWIASQAVGTAQCCVDLAVEYSKERDIFDRKLSDFQGHQFRLAEMEKKVQAARYLMYRAAWLWDIGEPEPLVSSCAKWFANEVISEVANEALLVHGGYGYTNEYRIERIFRDAKHLEIVEGTQEAEKMAVSRELLRR